MRNPGFALRGEAAQRALADHPNHHGHPSVLDTLLVLGFDLLAVFPLYI
jgi:hypothetical protein